MDTHSFEVKYGKMYVHYFAKINFVTIEDDDGVVEVYLEDLDNLIKTLQFIQDNALAGKETQSEVQE